MIFDFLLVLIPSQLVNQKQILSIFFISLSFYYPVLRFHVSHLGYLFITKVSMCLLPPSSAFSNPCAPGFKP